VGGIVHYWTKNFYINQTKISLLHNIELIALELQEIQNVDALALQVKKNLKLRITVVDRSGKVIAESHEDKTKMDNHRYRDEIVQSDSQDYGMIIRYSDTVKRDYLYVAKKYKFNDSFVYIRMARELEKIENDLLPLALNVGAILVLFFGVAFYLAYQVSLNLQEETNKILRFLLGLTKQKKTSYIDSDFSQEFAKITKLLSKVSQILNKKDKQKAKYTAKLKKLNTQKDDIISAISHEFKNPIAIINGYSQTLLNDDNVNQEIQKKFLNKILSNGQRLSNLIDTLRLSIKLDEGKQPFNFVNLNINQLAKDTVSNLKPNYKKRKIVVEENAQVTIKADETLMSIAVSNLIENALKYSEDTVTVLIDENSFSVLDKGIGISEEDLERITSKYFRVSNNGWNNSLGLGLSIVSNILQLHRFRLKIESTEDVGSTFSIKF
jgi:signal transduction histidine kinase